MSLSSPMLAAAICLMSGVADPIPDAAVAAAPHGDVCAEIVEGLSALTYSALFVGESAEINQANLLEKLGEVSSAYAGGRPGGAITSLRQFSKMVGVMQKDGMLAPLHADVLMSRAGDAVSCIDQART